MRGWCAIALALAMRSANVAMPSAGFNGFCGETSHHTSSRSR
jgi:hypothetical protein